MMDWKTLTEQKQWEAAAKQAAIEHGQPLSPQLIGNRYIYIGQEARKVGEKQIAVQFFEKGLALIEEGQSKEIIHAWISECQADLTNFAEAQKHFSFAMQVRHQNAMLKGPKKMAIAFSLFGALPEYCEYAALNVDLFPKFYPDATLVIYHDDSVPKPVLHRLIRPYVELINIKTIDATHMPGTFWRFLALENPQYEVVLIRDIDSFPTSREATLVQEWLVSGKPFHLIRDWFSHSDLILAGLWGARSGLLAGIRQWINQYLKDTPYLHPTHADQNFLADWVWPRIYPYALHHSWLNNNLNANWPLHLPTVSKNTEALGAFLLTNLKPEIEPPYRFSIMEGTTEICSYEVTTNDGFTIPTPYMQKIHQGQYQFKIEPVLQVMTIKKP